MEVVIMKRWTIGSLTLLGIGIVAGAAYLGTQPVGGSASTETQRPQTVEVTRGDVQTTVTAPGHLVYQREAALAFAVGGSVLEVNVRPGDTVMRGETMARLDPLPLVKQVDAARIELELATTLLDQVQAGPSEAQFSAAELRLAQAQAALQQLRDGPSNADIAAAEAEVSAAQSELQRLLHLPDPNDVVLAQARADKAAMVLQQAQAAYDMVSHRPNVAMMPQALALHQATVDCNAAQAGLDAARKQPSPAILDAAKARLAAAESRLAEMQTGPSAGDLQRAELLVHTAEAEIAQLLATPTAADVQQAETAVKRAELALARAEADLEAGTLTAPFDAVVLDVGASPGELIGPGSGVIVLADRAALEVEATVIEEDLPLVQVGQQVILFFDAQPSDELLGSVARIVPQRIPGDRPLYPVYIAVQELPAPLLAGMTVDSSIVIDSRYTVLRLPRALVRARSDGTATIEIWTGAETEERSVRTGLRGDSYVEILEGLQAGEQVVTQ
jgi:HlyD family secretion protein